MPRHLPITEADRKKVRRLYAAGKKPAEIAQKMVRTGLTVDQISGIIERAGLPKLKPQIAEARAQSAREALENARAASLRDLEEMLASVNAGLKVDADQLKDAWDLVADPAGASSLMRAKALHLARLFKMHGLDVQPDENTGRVNTLALIFGRPEPENGEAHEPGSMMNVTRSAVPDRDAPLAATAAQSAAGDLSATLDFEDE